MAKGAGDDAEAIAEMMEEAGEPPLGNAPPDERPEPTPSEPEAPAPDQLAEEPAEEPAEDAAPAPAAAAPDVSALQAQVELLKQQNELWQRQLQFQQSARPAEPQSGAQAWAQDVLADPTAQQLLNQLTVTERDVADILSGGPQAAEILTRSLQAMVVLASRIIEPRLQGRYEADQGQRWSSSQQQGQASQWKSAWWEANSDLQPYELVVQPIAGQIAREIESGAFRGDAGKELATRTRAALTKMGIRLSGRAGAAVGGAARTAAPASVQRIRPTVTEMGAGRTGRAKGGLTDQQKIMASF